MKKQNQESFDSDKAFESGFDSITEYHLAEYVSKINDNWEEEIESQHVIRSIIEY